MKCPFCAHPSTQVLDSREAEEGAVIRRRRRCEACERRFTTYERIEMALPAVVKKDGNRVDFSRDKLRDSFRLALRKRPVSIEAVDAAILRIEDLVRSSGLKEIPTQQLGEWVMDELKQLDKIAYIRFASVYRNFADLNEFKHVIKEIS